MLEIIHSLEEIEWSDNIEKDMQCIQYDDLLKSKEIIKRVIGKLCAIL